ncbi:hypothetical protein Aperf_G00000097434 [Anoplocephala perfoliata]
MVGSFPPPKSHEACPSGEVKKLGCAGDEGSAQRHFELDPVSGNLTIKAELDRETEPHYSFQIYSVDKGTPRQTAYCRVNIEVLDVNDNAPKFVYPTQMNHTIHFSSWNTPTNILNDLWHLLYKWPFSAVLVIGVDRLDACNERIFLPEGSPLLKLTATDLDAGVNAEKIFLIAEGNEKGIFQLDIQTGDLSLKPGLDPIKVAGRYNLKLEVRDDGSPSLSGFTHVTVILDAARPPPSSPPHSSGRIAIDQVPQRGAKEILKPERGSRDRILPYTGSRSHPAEPQTDWNDSGIEESFFGGEHTLILIICLSAIATMLVLILFIFLAWMRRRSLLAASRRGNHHGLNPGGQGQLKNIFVEGMPRAVNIASPTGWGDGKMDEMLTTAMLTKQSSPVYWLKTSAGSKATLDGKNIHLQTVKSNDSDFSDDTIPPTLLRGDLQQANNCLYATSPTRKVVYQNPTMSGTTPVITCDDRGDTYLSIPSTSFSGGSTKYIVDFPVGSVYQSLIRSTPNEDQDIPEARPIPLTPALYRTVCNSLPTSKASKTNTPIKDTSETLNETYQPTDPRLHRCKSRDRDNALIVDNDGENDIEAFPQLPKKSVEFASGGDETCLLVLPSDEDPRDAESEEVDQSHQKQTGAFNHMPSSFV